MVSIANAIVPDDNCLQIAKNSICFKFYPKQITQCLQKITPVYDKVTLKLNFDNSIPVIPNRRAAAHYGAVSLCPVCRQKLQFLDLLYQLDQLGVPPKTFNTK